MTKSPEPRIRTTTSGQLGTETPQARIMQMVSLAHKLCDEGRASEAEDLARSLLAQTPTLPSAVVVLARARAQQGQLEQARSLLEQVVARNPAFFTAHRWLAEVLVAIGDYPRASEVLVRAEAISPGQPRVAELIQLVMGAPRAGPGPTGQAPPMTGPAPPVTAPTAATVPPARRRRTTYEGPAVKEDTPQLQTLVPPPGGAAAPPPRATRQMPAPPVWTYAPSGPSAPASSPRVRTRRRLRLQLQLRLGERLRALSQRARAWVRAHPTAALTIAGVTLFLVAALAVILASWALRTKPGLTRRDRAASEAAREEEGSPPAGDEEEGAAPLGSAGFEELIAVLVKERRLSAPRPTPSANRALLATALLASEYGRAVDRPTEAWADDLVASLGNETPPEDLAAARVLLRVARGDRAGAEAAARALGLDSGQSPLIRFVEARRLTRNGDGVGALERLGPDAERSPFPPGRLLLGELALDSGDAERALAIARGVLGESPRHPLALQLLMESHQARGGQVPPEEAATMAQACKEDETRVPSLAAACRLDRAETLRRQGARRGALVQAQAAAEVVPTEPRLLSVTSQMLANLGAIKEANILLARAEVLADRSLPPLAWARIGVELATNRRVQLPSGPPPGPEARLVAARSAFVRRGDSPGRTQLLDSLTKSLPGDPDLQFMARGARARSNEDALDLSLSIRAQYGLVPPGPLASYVAGTLARRGGLRPLARLWLSKALNGHGDACRAATLYRMAIRENGRNPMFNARLQRAIGRLGCDRLPK
jgi:tetratricopeptide (TPR) repeat protein